MTTGTLTPPVADWVDPVQLQIDPYPTYERLRAEAPVAFVPFMGQYFVSRYEDCKYVEMSPTIFSSDAGTETTIHQTMRTRTMVQADDPEHTELRQPINSGLRPRAIKERWTEAFRANTRFYMDRLADTGPDHADLNKLVASPLAAKNLLDMLGFRDVEAETVREWSASIVRGLGNVAQDPDTWAEVNATVDEIDARLDELIPYLRQHPDNTLTSAFIEAGRPDASIKANVRLILSGGVNEPQHAVTNMVWALTEHPEQRDDVFAHPELWPDVFEESLRWLSPIGFVPRSTREEVELAGVTVPAGSVVSSLLASANRDDRVFENPDAFDIRRAKTPNLAFGAGPHQCAGAWVARWAVGSIAVPMLYERFDGLRNAEDRSADWFGFVFRGLVDHPVTWDKDRGNN
ncbi:MAG: cytochrome P450 [Leucobacter sp.]